MVTMPSNKNLRGRERRNSRMHQVRSERALERARVEGLTRLVELLEAETYRNPPRAGRLRADAMSRIARLHNARAAYALATTGEMQRMGTGAWLRRRHAVHPADVS